MQQPHYPGVNTRVQGIYEYSRDVFLLLILDNLRYCQVLGGFIDNNTGLNNIFPLGAFLD